MVQQAQRQLPEHQPAQESSLPTEHRRSAPCQLKPEQFREPPWELSHRNPRSAKPLELEAVNSCIHSKLKPLKGKCWLQAPEVSCASKRSPVE